MGFIVKNNGFLCEYCGEKNLPAKKTCRNHCLKCLFSKHVDDVFPGDRMSNCGGKMKIKEIIPNSKNDWILTHQCEKCGKIIKNKIAEDDNREMLFIYAKELSGT